MIGNRRLRAKSVREAILGVCPKRCPICGNMIRYSEVIGMNGPRTAAEMTGPDGKTCWVHLYHHGIVPG